ncbi:MAG: mechanosensitive ion channel [Rhodospirillales bacterium]
MSPTMRGVCALPGLAVLALLLTILSWPPAALSQAAVLGAVQDQGPATGAQALPEDLSPEMVDGLLARMTDADIRDLLRQELQKRAEEHAAAEVGEIDALGTALERMAEMRATIETRVLRWADALANLDRRQSQVEARLALAEGGVGAMLVAALALLLAGLVAGFLVARATSRWRRWLTEVARAGYWDCVVRSSALLAIELLPVLAFVVATELLAPHLGPWLGPLTDYVWIYQTGVSYGWAFIVVARRVYAPDAPAIRIAPLGDAAAQALHRLVRRAVLIGLAGWLLAGLSPTFGLGFAPAMVTVALAGSGVALLLVLAVLRNRQTIALGLAGLLPARPDLEAGQTAGARLLATLAPVILAGYILIAWVYWLSHWLERGAQELEGPVNTLLVLLLLPILDRAGSEIINSILRLRSPATVRFRAVFRGAWRSLLGLVTVFLVASFWGLDLLHLAKGPMAPDWASTLFDVILTLLIGHLVWRLIKAALYRDKPMLLGDDEEEHEEVGPSSRLDTLLPLFRNILLGVLAIVVVMIVLSSLGVDIGPLLASAGIIGIAIGFGAQTLVRDIFSGAFFLIDDAFRVGEYIELEQDLRGEVEAISIRSLQLRHHRGPVITIPFGELKSVTNHNRDWVIYKMNFRMEPDTDPNLVKKIVKEVGKELMAHPEHGPKFIEPLKSQGVYMIDEDSALVIRVKFMCKPRAQFVLRREIYHRLREVFNERGVRLARRKVEVVSGDKEADDPVLRGAIPDEALTGGPSP